MIGTAFGAGTPLAYPTQSLTPNLPQLLQQAVQLLQVLPQQLQQVQQLQSLQHQQIQQLLQSIPAQLAQLQQSIQFMPQQIQQLQQGASFQQPYGQFAGNSGYGIATPWGFAPQAIGAQPSHVM